MLTYRTLHGYAFGEGNAEIGGNSVLVDLLSFRAVFSAEAAARDREQSFVLHYILRSDHSRRTMSAHGRKVRQKLWFRSERVNFGTDTFVKNAVFKSE